MIHLIKILEIWADGMVFFEFDHNGCLYEGYFELDGHHFWMDDEVNPRQDEYRKLRDQILSKIEERRKHGKM